ncbi:MAG TPA: D-alanine--D-alanine ligase [Candidatus Saccharimonadales bacterium]|nr:D-alanine--D-alanine ligase [Candidatus Saccharimonadales bacterium]
MSKRVLVLQGGRSNERAVSLRSAAAVTEALRVSGYEVALGDPAEADFDLEKLAKDCGVVLIMIHGIDGEDGAHQRQLEILGKPFLGSGSVACDLTLNKDRYRELVTKHGVRMAAGEVVNQTQFNVSSLRQAPYVLKPLAGGSSVDTVIVHDMLREPGTRYFDDLFAKYGRMLLEELIAGQEITIGVLGDQPLPVILIKPPENGDFDYENKYNGRSQEIVNPAQIPSETLQEAQELALRTHQLTGCLHLSRTDMIVTANGGLFVLETNTLPGMTAQSLFPKMAAAVGYDMPRLVDRFVQMALEQSRDRELLPANPEGA